MVIYNIVHIQCLLRVDGSILAGVFLSSCFCVVPKSPHFSDTASSSLLAAWYSNCSSAASSTKSQWLQKLVFVQLNRSLDYSYSPVNCCCNAALRLNDVPFVVTVYREFSNSSPHEVSGETPVAKSVTHRFKISLGSI